MAFLLSLIFLAFAAAAIGGVLGLIVGIESERKRCRQDTNRVKEVKDEKTPADYVPGAVWRS